MFNRILDVLSRRLELDIKHYARNAAYLFSAYGVSIVTAIVSSVALARLLSKDAFGEYSYILSILGLASVLSLPGMNTAITQAVARGHERVFVEGTKARVKWSTAGSFAIFGAGIYYLLKGSTSVGGGLVIAAFFFPALYALNTFYSYFYGKKFFLTSSKVESLIKVISTIVIVVVVYFLRDVRLIVLAYAASISLLYIFIFLRIKKKHNLNDSTDEKAISYGKHLTLMNIIQNTRKYFDKIIIANFLGFTDVAVYSIALGLSEQIKVVGGIVNILIFPDLARKEKVAAYEAVRKRLPLVTIVFGIICGIGILVSPYLIPLLYGAKYSDAVFYTQVLFFSFLIGTPSIFIINLLQTQTKISDLYKVNISVSMVEIISLSILVPQFALTGAVLAKLISRIFSLFLSLFLVMKK